MSKVDIARLHMHFPWLNLTVYGQPVRTDGIRYSHHAEGHGWVSIPQPDSHRVTLLSRLIADLCERLAGTDRIPLDWSAASPLPAWLGKLTGAIGSISSIDFILGWDADVIVEQGGWRTERKGELSALVNAIKVVDGKFDWSSLAPRERVRIAKLLFTIGAGIRMEEFNRIRTVDNLHFFLARKLAALESLLNYEIVATGDDASLVHSIAAIESAEKDALAERRLQKLVLAETKYRYIYIDRDAYCEETFRRVGGKLFSDKAMGAQATQAVLLRRYLDAVGIQRAMAGRRVAVAGG